MTYGIVHGTLSISFKSYGHVEIEIRMQQNTTNLLILNAPPLK